MQLKYWPSVFSLVFFIGSCTVRPSLLLREEYPQIPNYSHLANWAAHPDIVDSADAVPSDQFRNTQEQTKADVFFLHPTTYTGDKGQKWWNAPLNNTDLNKKTDRSAILHQASIFNGAGRIYAPRYRQAHLHAFFTKKEPIKSSEAFELAYADIKNAFKYYLDTYNGGRPIILACHSQGTVHGMRLLKEFFEDKPLQEKLVVAYLVGIAVPKDYFTSIPICEDSLQTNCFCSWRSYRTGYTPHRFVDTTAVVVNPLSWTTDHAVAPKSLNQGTILRKFHKEPVIHLSDAQIYQGVLWVSKPKFPGSFLLTTRNYHVGDYNLFWVNVRKNVEARTKVFLQKNK